MLLRVWWGRVGSRWVGICHLLLLLLVLVLLLLELHCCHLLLCLIRIIRLPLELGNGVVPAPIHTSTNTFI